MARKFKPYEEVASRERARRASPMHTEGEGRDHGGEDFQGPSGLQHGLCLIETELGGISERLQMMVHHTGVLRATLTPTPAAFPGMYLPTSTWGGTALCILGSNSMVCFCREGIKDKHKSQPQDLSYTLTSQQPNLMLLQGNLTPTSLGPSVPEC